MAFREVQKVPKLETGMHSVTKKMKNKYDIFQSNFFTFKIKEFCENQIFTFLLVGATVFEVHQFTVSHFLATLMG